MSERTASKTSRRRFLVTALAPLALVVSAVAQVEVIESPFPIEPKAALYKWDSVHNQLIFYRDVNDVATPAVRAYAGGVQAGNSVYPLKDFPGAIGVDLWSVAAAPGGGLVLSAVVQYGGTNTKAYVLTYDSAGSLRRLWAIYPYHHHQVAVDRDGSVYAFGHREDRGEGGDEPDYPLLIKYSPAGEVVWETLSRGTFPHDTEIVVTNAQTLEHWFSVVGDSVVLYVSTTRELIQTDAKSGRLLSRRALAPLMDQIASSAGMDSAWLFSMVPTAKGSLLVQFRVSTNRSANPKIGFVTGLLSIDTSSWKQMNVQVSASSLRRLIGISRDARPMFLKPASDGQENLVIEYGERMQ